MNQTIILMKVIQDMSGMIMRFSITSWKMRCWQGYEIQTNISSKTVEELYWKLGDKPNEETRPKILYKLSGKYSILVLYDENVKKRYTIDQEDIHFFNKKYGYWLKFPMNLMIVLLIMSSSPSMKICLIEFWIHIRMKVYR